MAVNKVEYAGKILIDLTADTVASDKMLLGVTGHDKAGQKIEGSIQNNGAVTGTISAISDVYSIQAGYHDGNGKVSIDENEISKLVAENIKKGVTILGVTGTYDGTSIEPDVEDHTEINSITLDGNCYFDTEIFPDQNTNTEAKLFVDTGSAYICGARDDNYKYGYTMTDNFYAVRGTVSSAAKATSYWQDVWIIKQSGQNFVFTASANSNTLIIDAINSFTLTSPFYVGCMSKNGEAAGNGLKGKIYYAKIYSGSNLVADMIPVKKKDGTLCLYDKVRKKYLYKSGSGTVTQ